MAFYTSTPGVPAVIFYTKFQRTNQVKNCLLASFIEPLFFGPFDRDPWLGLRGSFLSCDGSRATSDGCCRYCAYSAIPPQFSPSKILAEVKPLALRDLPLRRKENRWRMLNFHSSDSAACRSVRNASFSGWLTALSGSCSTKS